jgi:hypothetical protein
LFRPVRIRDLCCAATRQDRGQKKSAAADPKVCAARAGGRMPRESRAVPAFYLVTSGRGDPSSITHGQKFCGLRMLAAFFTTVIFMSVLRFG